MTPRTVVVSLAVTFACALSSMSMPGSAAAKKPDGVIRGSATYRERVALTRDATLEATLEDVSRADGRADVVSRVRVANPGQIPIDFEIHYKARKIDPHHHYVVRASIYERGRLRFTTDRGYPVLRGEGHRVRVLLKMVRGDRDGGGRGPGGDRGQSSGQWTGLANTRWALVRLEGVPVRVPERQREPWIQLDGRSMRVTGSGGCNRISGNYHAGRSTLQFGELISTKMACISGTEMETAFLRVLDRTRAFRIHGRSLDLLDDVGRALAQLEERNL